MNSRTATVVFTFWCLNPYAPHLILDLVIMKHKEVGMYKLSTYYYACAFRRPTFLECFFSLCLSGFETKEDLGESLCQ